MDPIEQLASLIVERHNLEPPVDIRALVEQHADLEYCSWHFACDGIAVLSFPRPKVFIKTDQWPRRERFTLAHELGHALIPWHTDAVNCKPSELNPTDRESFLGIHQETEANRFASRVLVPDRFLAPFTQQYTPAEEVLTSLEKADISAAAGILAIQRALLPGYVFITPTLGRPVSSHGTHYQTDRVELRNSAPRQGVVTHQGQQVEWFQFAEAVESDRPTSPSDAANLLHEIGASPTARQFGDNLPSRVQGVIGRLASKHTNLDQSTWLGVLIYSFAYHPHLAALASLSDFRTYLSFRAFELANRKQKKPSRQPPSRGSTRA